MRTDGRKDTRNLTVVFLDFAKAPKNLQLYHTVWIKSEEWGTTARRSAVSHPKLNPDKTEERLTY